MQPHVDRARCWVLVLLAVMVQPWNGFGISASFYTCQRLVCIYVTFLELRTQIILKHTKIYTKNSYEALAWCIGRGNVSCGLVWKVGWRKTVGRCYRPQRLWPCICVACYATWSEVLLKYGCSVHGEAEVCGKSVYKIIQPEPMTHLGFLTMPRYMMIESMADGGVGGSWRNHFF